MCNRLYQSSVYSTVLTIMLGSSALADVKKAPYPKVPVELAEAYKPDAAFTAMRKAFVDATARKDASALFALVAPGFVSAVNGAVASDYDHGRDPLYNFKVVFGFRQPGKDADGGVEDGPFWASLAAFASEDTFSQPVEGGKLVCSPIAAAVADEAVLEQARTKIESDDEQPDWYLVLRDTPVTRAPNDKGQPVGKLGQQAVPVLGIYPEAAPEGQPQTAPTHYEVLLPSGASGWIPVAAVLPMETSRLCYAVTPGGAWKIGLYDAAE
jgi:hypothetical protein